MTAGGRRSYIGVDRGAIPPLVSVRGCQQCRTPRRQNAARFSFDFGPYPANIPALFAAPKKVSGKAICLVS